jgi:hypothetical protein
MFRPLGGTNVYIMESDLCAGTDLFSEALASGILPGSPKLHPNVSQLRLNISQCVAEIAICAGKPINIF